MEKDEYNKLLSEIEDDATEAFTQWVQKNWCRPIKDPFDKYYLCGGKKIELDILMDYDEDETIKVVEQAARYAMRAYVIEEDDGDIHTETQHNEIEEVKNGE